jgi:hypothetical protein
MKINKKSIYNKIKRRFNSGKFVTFSSEYFVVTFAPNCVTVCVGVKPGLSH